MTSSCRYMYGRHVHSPAVAKKAFTWYQISLGLNYTRYNYRFSANEQQFVTTEVIQNKNCNSLISSFNAICNYITKQCNNIMQRCNNNTIRKVFCDMYCTYVIYVFSCDCDFNPLKVYVKTLTQIVQSTVGPCTYFNLRHRVLKIVCLKSKSNQLTALAARTHGILRLVLIKAMYVRMYSM